MEIEEEQNEEEKKNDESDTSDQEDSNQEMIRVSKLIKKIKKKAANNNSEKNLLSIIEKIYSLVTDKERGSIYWQSIDDIFKEVKKDNVKDFVNIITGGKDANELKNQIEQQIKKANELEAENKKLNEEKQKLLVGMTTDKVSEQLKIEIENKDKKIKEIEEILQKDSIQKDEQKKKNETQLLDIEEKVKEITKLQTNFADIQKKFDKYVKEAEQDKDFLKNELTSKMKENEKLEQVLGNSKSE